MLMNAASIVGCPAPKSLPLPLDDVFQTVDVYPILVIPTAGMSISVPMILLEIAEGNCPTPELESNEMVYCFAIHFGNSVRVVL